MNNAADSTSTVSRRSGTRGVFPPPRKLNDEQEHELVRVYSETRTPTSEIARTFGISETSVARVALRHGATLRRRGRVPGSATTRASSSTTTTRATPPTRGRRAATTRATSSASVLRRFRITFRGERVVEATDMRAAVAQVEAEGAIEISSISVE